VAVIALSGWLFHLGVRLRPVAVASWLAPLPLLVIAPRVSLPLAVCTAAGAWLVGQLGLWSYYRGGPKIPALLVAVQFAGGSLGIAAIVALARAYLLAGRLVVAAVSVPAAWVAMEFLTAWRSPHGAWWSVAYSQADLPRVIKVASWTGVFGVTALVLLPASTVAAVTAPTGTVTARFAALAIAVATIAVVTWYAVRRDRSTSSERVQVGLVSAPAARVPIGSSEGEDLANRCIEDSKELAARGARVIVLPELTFVVDDTDIGEQMKPFARAAADLGVDIVVGAARQGRTAWANIAVVFHANGNAPAQYLKQHLVPGVERDYRPGREPLLVTVDGQLLGVLICKDLDFPQLVRSYRRRGARLILAPAWDFGRDGWLHSRMAVVRGVESGIPIARVARDGRATISDRLGNVIADANSDDGTTIDARIPLATASTVYARFGDWFGWTCAIATAVLVLVAALR
jgi:apolipoprotein N-acyltransferase